MKKSLVIYGDISSEKSIDERKRKMNAKKTITAILSAAILMSQMSGLDAFANHDMGSSGKHSGGQYISATGTQETGEGTALSTVATPSVIEHKISYELDGGTYENAPQKYTEGVVLVLGEPTKDKCIFEGWRVEENNDGILKSLTDNKIDASFTTDLKLYAKWAEAYTVSYDFGTVRNAKMPDGYITKYKKGIEKIKLAEPTAHGYEFKGWQDDFGNEYTEIDTANPKNLILTAQWNKITAVVDYRLNGGKNPSDAVYAYTKDSETFNLPTPTREGYVFDGWYSNEDLTGERVTQIVKGTDKDTTVYAKWTKAFQIIYNNIEGVTGFENAPKSFNENSETIDLPTPIKDGYIFDGWYLNESFEGEKVTQIIKGTKNDIILYAKLLKEYKITYNNIDGAIGLDSAPNSYAENSDEIVLPIPTKADTKFLGWKTDADKDGNADTRIEKIEKGAATDIELYAEWEETCKITYVTNGGTMPDDAPTTYKTGLSAELAIPSRTGYKFKGWYTDEQFKNSITRITEDMRGDITVYATWERRSSGGTLGGAKYFVRFDSRDGTEIPEQLLQSGATARKPENPTRSGYTFAGWYADRNCTEKFDFDTKIKKTITLYAKWTKIGEDDYSDAEFDKLLVLTIGSKQAKINGRIVTNDVAPVLRNDRTMMPIRFVAEGVGAKVLWDQDFRIVTIRSETKQVIIHIGSDIAYVNGAIYNLDSPAYIENDRTYVPIRFVSEAIDCEVDWNEKESKVYIMKK